MSDDWEDWEADDFQPQLPQTVGQAALSKAGEPDASKFAGEDEDLDTRPAWVNSVPKPQQKKAAARPSYEDRGATVQQLDEPLDDPVSEKLRKQKLVEDADLRSAKDLFDGAEVSLESLSLKSAKDFEQFGKLLAQKYVSVHSKSSHYKALLKAFLREVLATSDVQLAKDVETSVSGIRSDKLKEEKSKQAAAKAAGKKKNLNAGRGGASAGLDDYQYDQALDDEVDFM